MASRRVPREHELTIDELLTEGLGRTLLNEREVRVRNALPGERVTARILKKRRGVRFADAVSVAEPHRDRVTPVCAFFPRCGGCVMHHMAQAAQLDLKQRALNAALAEQGVAAASWSPPVSVAQLGYRRKARLGVRVVGGRVLVGFRESFSNRVARMDACAVLAPRLSALIPALQSTIQTLSIADQVPQVELAAGDRHATIIVRHLQPLTGQDEAHWVEFADRFDVQVLLQSGGYETLRCVRSEPIELLSYALYDAGVTMRFHPAQFTQVNAGMNAELIRTAVGYLGTVNGKRIADLFCGIGNFSLPLGRRGAQVEGYEIAADAVAQAKANAALNGIKNCDFAAADLYEKQGVFRLDVDAMLLDPPRSGAGPNLEAWVQNERCSQVVYVSCNPSSFAADAKLLKCMGFSLSRVGVFDMFPHTAHVETVGNFIRG